MRSVMLIKKIEQAKIIMNENVFKDIDPEELAMKLNISYSWFRKVFKDYTGYAPAKYFQELKLRKAKAVVSRYIPVCQGNIFLCSIINPLSISSLFSKTYWIYPLEYRSFGRETGIVDEE